MAIFICSILVLLKPYICTAYLLLQIVPQMSDVAPEPLVTLSANQTITSQIHWNEIVPLFFNLNTGVQK